MREWVEFVEKWAPPERWEEFIKDLAHELADDGFMQTETEIAQALMYHAKKPACQTCGKSIDEHISGAWCPQ